jgi:AAA15 family ATPase/GTPase
MKLISKIIINEFRSIRENDNILDNVGNFSVFAGLNNSGKSNILRALNAFFAGYTDTSSQINFKIDYNRFELHRKKKGKSIDISVTFNLPINFRFREEYRGAEGLLGRTFTIKKSWRRDVSAPAYFLNDERGELKLEDRQKIDQFLSLINFRYIPNRVLPIDIIKNEHQALRDVLVRRLGKEAKASGETFDKIQSISSTLIKSLSERMQRMKISSKNVRLATPKDWADMIFAFGYKLGDGKIEVEDTAQGSGIQSLLMLETLYLIDKDYYQQFGWRQASVWAIEEPESSLHCSLEAQIASFLRNISTGESNRLQILATTHSDIVIQYSDRSFYVTQADNETKIRGDLKLKDIIRESEKAGISRYTHPLLYNPSDSIIFVDGKYDKTFFEKAIPMIAPKSTVKVFCMEELKDERTGGEKEIFGYLKKNKDAILCRNEDSPIIVVLDWESKDLGKYKPLSRELGKKLHVLQWNDSEANPKLTKNFRGMERFYSDRLIGVAIVQHPGLIGKTKEETYTLHQSDAETIKKALDCEINKNGLKENDLLYAKAFINKILKITSPATT